MSWVKLSSNHFIKIQVKGCFHPIWITIKKVISEMDFSFVLCIRQMSWLTVNVILRNELQGKNVGIKYFLKNSPLEMSVSLQIYLLKRNAHIWAMFHIHGSYKTKSDIFFMIIIWKDTIITSFQTGLKKNKYFSLDLQWRHACFDK